MKIWEALVMGLVKGASEYLTISSSGHLLLLEKLGIGQENLFFNIMLHVGTLAAVFIALCKKMVASSLSPYQQNQRIYYSCVRADGSACVRFQVACAVAYRRQTAWLRICLDGVLVICG